MAMMSVGVHTPGQGKIASINAQRKFFFHQLFSNKYLKGLSHEMDLVLMIRMVNSMPKKRTGPFFKFFK
jgi:hypothetical protein